MNQGARKHKNALSPTQKSHLAKKENKEIQRFLMPNAPDRKQNIRKPSPARVACPLASGTPVTPPKLARRSIKMEKESATAERIPSPAWVACPLASETPVTIGNEQRSIKVEWESPSAASSAAEEMAGCRNDNISSTIVFEDSLPGPFSTNASAISDDDVEAEDHEMSIGHSPGSDLDQEECDPLGDVTNFAIFQDRLEHSPADAEDHLPTEVCSLLNENDREDDLALRTFADADMLNFNWVQDPDVFKGQREVFTGKSGPTIGKKLNSSPLAVFEQIWDDDIIDLIVTETNHYANSMISTSSAGSALHRWKNIDKADIWLLFATLMLQSLVHIAPEKEYWYPSILNLAPPIFKQLMPFKKFQLLKKCLHFVDNSSISSSAPTTKKLAKIEPIIEHLNKKFSALYLPDQNICIDESLLLRKGKLSFSQLISNKAAKVGIKSCELCDSRTGYLWKMLVYAGKGSTQQEDGKERPDVTESATSQIVYKLVRPLLNKGHTLVMDNFYNSPLLSRSLKVRKTDTMGTLRVNRAYVPDSLKATTKANMRQGEVAYSQTEDLSVVVWRDSNLVSLISTYHKVDVGGKEKHGYYKSKPQLVLDYNMSMAGVDKKDQLLAGYNLERSRNAVWYKKLFRRLLNISIHNSYIIHSHGKRGLHREFRLTLAHQIVTKYRGLLPGEIPAQIRVIDVGTNQYDRKRPKLEGGHYLEKGESSQARCKWCAKSKVLSRTAWRCDTCKVSLCINYCFKQYHTL